MANRNALLGRSRPREKLTREEITALDKATVPPALPRRRRSRSRPGTGAEVRSGWSAGTC